MKTFGGVAVLLAAVWFPVGAAARNHHATFRESCSDLAKKWHGTDSYHGIFTAEFNVHGEPEIVTYFVIATSIGNHEVVVPGSGQGGQPRVGTTRFHIGIGLLTMNDNADGSCTVGNHGDSAKSYLKSRAKEAGVRFE